jgi:CO/xanthine dehydrogenase FAD-binding subunit
VSGTLLVADVAAVLGAQPPGPPELARAAALAAAAVTEPWGDLFASAEYRAAVAGPVAHRALASALDDARSSQEAV